MNLAAAAALCRLNTLFYERNAASFSDTRQSGWPGWERVAELAGVSGDSCEAVPFRVLDVACGNLRFESYLERQFPQVAFDFAAVDNCDDLVAAASAELSGAVSFSHVDVTEVLLRASRQAGESIVRAAESAARPSDPTVQPSEAIVEVPACASRLAESFATDSCDLAVAFGFLHHVPLHAWRAAVLRALLASVRPGGVVAVSLWEFMNSPQLAKKAQATHAEALAWCASQAKGETAPIENAPIDFATLVPDAFGPGDYLLGWNNQPGQYRYCHSFTPAEIDELVSAVADVAQLEARFHADGRTNDLNEYLVFRAR